MEGTWMDERTQRVLRQIENPGDKKWLYRILYGALCISRQESVMEDTNITVKDRTDDWYCRNCHSIFVPTYYDIVFGKMVGFCKVCGSNATEPSITSGFHWHQGSLKREKLKGENDG